MSVTVRPPKQIKDPEVILQLIADSRDDSKTWTERQDLISKIRGMATYYRNTRRPGACEYLVRESLESRRILNATDK